MPEMIETALIGQAGEDFYGEIIKDGHEHRVLVINEEVTDACLENYMLRIIKWNREDRDIPRDKRKEIKIYISSVGGDSFVAANFVDVVMQSKTPVVAVGFSLVASAAFHIFMAADERICFKNTIFLMHDGTITVSNTSKRAGQVMEFFQQRENDVKDYVLSRTKMTPEFYDSVYDSDFYMGAEKAVELGVADKIIGVDIDMDAIL